MSRIRQRYIINGTSVKRINMTTQEVLLDFSGNTGVEYMVDAGSKVPPFQENAVKHFKMTNGATGDAGPDSSDPNIHRFLTNFGGANDGEIALTYATQSLDDFVTFALEFQQNNKFELIPAVFDLDGTLAMFTRKFWRQISYGAVNWGLLPFVSDVKSLYNTCLDYKGRILDQLTNQMEVEKTFPLNYNDGIFTFRGTIRLTGTYWVSSPVNAITSLKIFADELGVHPDLKTIWDVIPLSFVADYFLPVGDYLESVHPRGWFNPVIQFTGNGTISGQWSRAWGLEGQKPTAPYSSGKGFSRGISISQSFTKDVNKSPNWQCPNPRQVFNTAYLGLGRWYASSGHRAKPLKRSDAAGTFTRVLSKL